MIDFQLAIKEHLADQPGLTGILLFVGVNEPPPGYKPETGPAICFRNRGGEPAYDDSHYDASVQFKCYDTSGVKAWAVYRALHTALQNSGGAVVRWARAEGLGTPLNEQSTGWPFILCYFTISVLEA